LLPASSHHLQAVVATDLYLSDLEPTSTPIEQVDNIRHTVLVVVS